MKRYAKRFCYLSLWIQLVLTGCQQPQGENATKSANQPSEDSSQDQTQMVTKSLGETSTVSEPKKSSPGSVEVPGQEGDAGIATQIVKKSFVSGNTNSFATKSLGGGSERKTSLTKAVLEYALEAQESNPTVLIWIFDQTKSATKLREQVVSEIKSGLDSVLKEAGPEMAVAGFSSQGVEFLNPEPTSQKVEIVSALEKLTSMTGEQEGTFTALWETVNKFESLKKSARKTVMLILVTDEAGDDARKQIDGKNAIDALMDRLQSLSVPLFAIGYAAPFGRESDLVEGSRPEIVYGPETVHRERIRLGLWNGSNDIFRFDSGFGPWNLERVCRATGGRFLADRPIQKSTRIISKMQSNWPAATSRQFSDSAMAAYKPFYGSEEDYLADVNSNKAKTALHQAAKLPYARVFRIQDYEFRQTDEAALARQINMTQRIPAVIQPGLEKLYTMLKAGEAGRDSLKSKRWQASFDLAYGRSLANYVRVIGLNSMLAELKSGKSFSESKNNTWILEPADEVSTGTSNQKMADKARIYLQRVVDEHPDTPWARVAKLELESPLGWKWTEAQR